MNEPSHQSAYIDLATIITMTPIKASSVGVRRIGISHLDYFLRRRPEAPATAKAVMRLSMSGRAKKSVDPQRSVKRIPAPPADTSICLHRPTTAKKSATTCKHLGERTSSLPKAGEVS
jgi:hypothetical protein